MDPLRNRLEGTARLISTELRGLADEERHEVLRRAGELADEPLPSPSPLQRVARVTAQTCAVLGGVLGLLFLSLGICSVVHDLLPEGKQGVGWWCLLLIATGACLVFVAYVAVRDFPSSVRHLSLAIACAVCGALSEVFPHVSVSVPSRAWQTTLQSLMEALLPLGLWLLIYFMGLAALTTLTGVSREFDGWPRGSRPVPAPAADLGDTPAPGEVTEDAWRPL